MSTLFEPGVAVMGSVDVAGSALGDDELFDGLSDTFLVASDPATFPVAPDLATFVVARDEFTTVVASGVRA